MASGSFMEKILEGVFDKTAFDSYRMPVDSEKVQSLLISYREMFKNHSPQKIEEEGRIPDEMLQEMRKKGFFGISLVETCGGLGVGLVDCIRFVEEISAQDLPTSSSASKALNCTERRSRSANIFLLPPRER